MPNFKVLFFETNFNRLYFTNAESGFCLFRKVQFAKVKKKYQAGKGL
jgi:hypothetical protein